MNKRSKDLIIMVLEDHIQEKLNFDSDQQDMIAELKQAKLEFEELS